MKSLNIEKSQNITKLIECHVSIVFIKLLKIVLVNFFEQFKVYNGCLISFLSFSELFSAFNWAKEIDNLQSIWCRIKI